MSDPEVYVKALVYGDAEKTLSGILKSVDQNSLGTGGTAVIALFALTCRFFADRSVSEITQFVTRARQGHVAASADFVRAGQALIRYALGEEAFEAALLTVLTPAEFVRIAARLLVSMVQELAIVDAEIDELLREASKLSRGFTLSSVSVEMLRFGGEDAS